MEDIINILADEDRVQVIFQKGTKPWVYKDAIWFNSIEEYNNTTSDMLEAMKTERYTNWCAVVGGPQ